MTRPDPLEPRLEQLFAIDMPAALVARTDARVGALSLTDRRASGRPPLKLRRSVLLALAATLTVAAVSIGALTLYERVAHLTWPGDRLAWERSVELDLTVETDAGTFTLARGYADANRIVLAFGTSGSDVVHGRELVDAQGRTYVPHGGFGYTEISGESVMLESWLAPEPLPAGEVDLTLSPHADAADWVLTFSLPVEGGVTLAAQQVRTAHDVSIALEQITFSPTAVVAEVRLSGLDAERSWVTIGGVAHDRDSSIGQNGMTSIEDEDDPMHQTIVVTTGTDTPRGDWTLRIDEVVGFDAKGDQVRMSGPWEFTVKVP